MEQYTLMNPGPVNTTDRVRNALQIGDLCHRETEYFDCQGTVRRLLLEVFGLNPERYTAILITGSGTAAMEATLCSTLGPGEKILVINNGVYGDRFARIARAHDIGHVELVFGWTYRPDLKLVARTLASDPSIRALAVVHHETTTGLINPLIEIAGVAREHHVSLIIDSVSGLGGEEFHFSALEPDYTISTANKCLQGLPGISFVLANRACIQRAATFPPRSVYLDLAELWSRQEQSSTPFTPAVQLLFAFREALRELAEETVQARIERYRSASAMLREGFEKLGLKLLLPSNFLSNTITTLYLPEGMRYEHLHDALKREGFVIYAGQGDLSRCCFRVANMGEIDGDDLERFLDVLGDLIPSRSS